MLKVQPTEAERKVINIMHGLAEALEAELQRALSGEVMALSDAITTLAGLRDETPLDVPGDVASLDDVEQAWDARVGKE